MDVAKYPALEKIDDAKRMVANNDYAGARSKLLEIQYQFPSLGKDNNLPRKITACDVLCASELIFSDGEFDWYWILQLSPMSSISQIRSQHKKLVTVLEAIKEEFPGSITALKLVNDAFFILSNPSKRLVFDSKRLTSWSDVETIISPVSSVDNTGSHSGKSVAQEQDTLGCESSISKKIDVVNVLDDNVDEKDLKIIEFDRTGKPPQVGEVPNVDEVNSVSSSVSKARNFEVGQIWAASDDENLPRKFARINSVSDSHFELVVTWLQPVPENEDEKKWCEAGLPVVCGLFNLDGDEETVVDCSIFSHWVSYTANPTYDEFRIHPQEDEVWAIYENWSPFEWCADPESRKGCSFKIIQILYLKEEEGVLVAEQVKFDGSQNIHRMDTNEGQECFEIPSNCFYRFSHRLPSYEEHREIEMGPASSGSLDSDPFPGNAKSFHSLPPFPVANRSSLKAEWTAVDITPGQVWAIYDGPDQMPRRYATVNSLLSNVIVSVNYLEPNPMREEDIYWVEENLPLGCGVFRVNPKIAVLEMNKFSHLVNCDRSNKQSFYRIYPRKGEVWAMYRNWNSKWKKRDFYHSRYRIVQITSDFCEQSGVQVASLEHVAGFKTFFQKQICDGFALNRAVKRAETLSFSHRVEAFVVPGIQAHGIPECSWHLEPDALPLVLSN